jgi:hypothetical protein
MGTQCPTHKEILIRHFLDIFFVSIFEPNNEDNTMSETQP